MDGVIVDTEPLHRKAYFKTFKELGIDVSEELYASFTGASTKRVCDTLIKNFNLKQTFEEIAKLKGSILRIIFIMMRNSTWFPEWKNWLSIIMKTTSPWFLHRLQRWSLLIWFWEIWAWKIFQRKNKRCRFERIKASSRGFSAGCGNGRTPRWKLHGNWRFYQWYFSGTPGKNFLCCI